MGARFLTVRERSYKYAKGENQNAPAVLDGIADGDKNAWFSMYTDNTETIHLHRYRNKYSCSWAVLKEASE